MIKVVFCQPQTVAWGEWKAKCARETESIQELVAGGAPPPAVGDLYKKQKSAVSTGYRGKCVFCEKRITSTQRGDIEHYRPKAAVQGEDWVAVPLSRGGRAGAHPGYWWLAYTTDNLLLSCIRCNQVAKGKEYGKGNRFPVAEFRAEYPGEEEHEEPLLLNPCRDSPTDHIVFDDTGICSPVNESKRGRVTIDILGLNKRDLPHERAERFKSVIAQVNLLLATRPPNWLQAIEDMKAPGEEFSAVARAAVKQVLVEVLRFAEIACAEGE